MDKLFARFANATARVTGSPAAFLICIAAVLLWAASGPAFKFSETWQLVINTGTTIVTFLMVFLIQNTQNRDGLAIQTKLDELIRASDSEDEFIGIEKLTDKELEALHKKCQRMSANSQRLMKQASQERDARKSKSTTPTPTPTPVRKTAARRARPRAGT
jgi:low affinity Fe/Cu permease